MINTQAIPDEIARCASLRVLHLDGNEITDISPLCCLTGLAVVSADCNAIEHLPADVKRLVSLEVLRVGYNRLHNVPDELVWPLPPPPLPGHTPGRVWPLAQSYSTRTQLCSTRAQ
jgi:Leucine-rich repeat (LRR) protein